MRVRKANAGEIFRCSSGHHYPEALLVEGQEPPHLNGTYCLVCFGARVIGRLAVPRATAVEDPFESVVETPPEEVPLAQAEEVSDPDKAQAEQPAAKPKPRAKRHTGAKRRR